MHRALLVKDVHAASPVYFHSFILSLGCLYSTGSYTDCNTT